MNKRNTVDAPWHLIGKELASPFGQGTTYLALPSKRNPRWIVPLANRAVAWRSLDLYAPSSRLGKLYRCLLRILTYIPAPLQMHRLVLDAAATTTISDYIALQGRGQDTYYVAISCGTAWARRKTTLQVMDVWGKPQFYLKIGQNPSARYAIKREAKMLGFLAKEHRELVAAVPCLLSLFEQGTDLVLVQQAGPTHYSDNVLTFAHWNFLSHLVRESEQEFPTDFLIGRNIASRLQILNSSVGAETISVLDRTLRFLEAARRTKMRICTEHGDFAPWNIRCHGRKRSEQLFVFDWEQGREAGMPMFDAFHFITQVSVLVRKTGAARTYHALQSLATDPGYPQYLARSDMHHSQFSQLIAAYLLSVTIESLELLEIPEKSVLQRTRISCLLQILRDAQ